MRSTRVLSLAGCALVLAGCGGGGGGGTVSGLSLPSQVNIVESSTNNNTVRLPRGLAGSTLTDYQNDRTQFWIHDESMGPLDTINDILEALDQTNYDDPTVINAGPYIALINAFDNGGEQGGDRSAPQYEEWVVDSSRASDSAPHIVKLWIKGEENMDGNSPINGHIYVRVVINEAPTSTKPYGDFTLYFKFLADTEQPNSTSTVFQGYLATVARNDGQAEFMFFNGHGDPDQGVPPSGFAMRERARVVGDPASRTGRAYTEKNFQGQNHQEQQEYQVQFNGNYVARKDRNNVLTVLDRNDFETHVWRYGVYNSTTEARIKNFGGFPVETQDGKRGWASHHGIWMDRGTTLTNGMTLIRRSHQNNTTTSYTAVVVPGKLEKRTRASITLADIVDEEMECWDFQNQQQILVKFDGTNWMNLGTRSGNGWNRLQNPTNANNTFANGQWTNLWSPHRGQIELTWTTSPATSTPAYRWTHSTISADSLELANGDLSLWCYNNMLRSNITQNQANFQNNESPYFPWPNSVNDGKNYVFNATTLLLTLDGNPCTLANGVTVSSGPGANGFHCGPLLTAQIANFSEMSQQTVTYNWNTGSQDWNQLRMLKDSNNVIVRFDPPLRFDYTHSEQGSPFNGRVFNLEWNGDHLGGIPHEENTGEGRWYPLFNIPSGTVVTAGETSYKVKQLEGEQIMIAVNNPNTIMTQEGFDLSTNIAAPTSGLYQDPAIGAKPTVTTPPRFVGGVDQQSSDG